MKTGHTASPFKMEDRMLKLFRRLGSKYYWKDRAYSLTIHIITFSLMFVFAYPFLYMAATSFKSAEDLLDITVEWIPRSFAWRNYVLAAGYLNYWPYFKNSVFVTSVCIAGHILSCSFIAYGFARFHFPGRDLLFRLVLLSLMVPSQVTIVPQFITYGSYGWLNTYLPLIVPTFLGFGLKGGLYIFIFRQFFLGLPQELENAARIDGCGPIKTYLKIVLPTSRTAILVSAVIAMVSHWNDYFEPLIYLTEARTRLLPAMLPVIYNLARDVATGVESDMVLNDAVIMAGVVLVVLPVLVMYSFLQRRFMEGVERTGLVE